MALIKKSNDLIQAKYNLTLNEQRLILYLCSRVQRTDKDFQDYEFTFADLIELTEIDKKFIYNEIKDIAKKLLSKPIVFVKSTGGQLICNWCSSFEFDKDTDTVKICFDPKLKPYLLDLKKCFTAYDKKYVSGFNSRYSFRIYELCKQYQKLKIRKMSIIELKLYLDLEDQYTRWSAFKDYVLTPAIADINKHSDLFVSVTYHKTRRSITHLTFNIKSGLEHCQNEKQEAEILQDKQAIANSQKKQAKVKKMGNDWLKKWEKLSKKDRQRWGGEGKGFVYFRACKGIKPDQ